MIPKILMAMLVVGSVALSACESVDGDTDLSVEEEQSALLNAIGSPCEGCALPSFMPRLCPDGSLVAPSAECVWGEDQTCETKITPAPACPMPVVGEGELCVGFAGPVATCEEGLECVNLSPDNSVCLEVVVLNAKDDNNKWRHVTVGNYIEVRLPQSTNGSEWEAITRLHNLKNIEYVTDYFEENAKDPTNNPGTHIFGFRAVSAGKTTVRFRNASKSFTLKLRITR